MSIDQTYSWSLTRLREKELILYVTFTVQITFPFGCEQDNTHNSPCRIRLKSCARKCAMCNFDIAHFLAQGLGFLILVANTQKLKVHFSQIHVSSSKRIRF